MHCNRIIHLIKLKCSALWVKQSIRQTQNMGMTSCSGCAERTMETQTEQPWIDVSAQEWTASVGWWVDVGLTDGDSCYPWTCLTALHRATVVGPRPKTSSPARQHVNTFPNPPRFQIRPPASHYLLRKDQIQSFRYSDFIFLQRLTVAHKSSVNCRPFLLVF